MDGLEKALKIVITLENDPSIRQGLDSTAQRVDKFIGTIERRMTEALTAVTRAANQMAGQVESYFKRMEAQAIRSSNVIRQAMEGATGGGGGMAGGGTFYPGAGGAGRNKRPGTPGAGGAGRTSPGGRGAGSRVSSIVGSASAGAMVGGPWGAAAGAGIDIAGQAIVGAIEYGKQETPSGLNRVQRFLAGNMWGLANDRMLNAFDRWKSDGGNGREAVSGMDASLGRASRAEAAFELNRRSMAFADIAKDATAKRDALASDFRRSEYEIASNRAIDTAGRLGANQQAIDRSRELKDTEALVRLEQERVQLIRQEAQEGVAAAQKRVSLAEREKSVIESTMKHRQGSVDSAAQRFIDADPLDRQKAQNAALKLQQGGSLNKDERAALSGMGLLDAFPELGNLATDDVRRRATDAGFYALGSRFGLDAEYAQQQGRLEQLSLQIQNDNKIVVEFNRNAEVNANKLLDDITKILKDQNRKGLDAINADDLRRRIEMGEAGNKNRGKIFDN